MLECRKAKAAARSQSIAMLFGCMCVAGIACEDDTISRAEPKLSISPDRLDFGVVELGQDATKPVRIENAEQVPGTIDSVRIVDDCGGCFIAIDAPTEVPATSSVALPIRFRAVRLAVATGTVTIETSDPALPSFVVTLVGRGTDSRRPDIEVHPERVDFGFAPAGGIALSSFVIRSTGTNDLLIDRIRIEPEGAPFVLTNPAPTPQNPGRLAPTKQASISLRAILPATQTGTVAARVVIETNVPDVKNVPDRPGVVEIPLVARSNLAPVAVASEDQTVEPWTRVMIDGSASYDRDDPPDDPLQYFWTMTSKPSGSTTVIERARTATASFWVDLTGTYELELMVVDALGLSSAEPAKVVIEAMPKNAIHIELTWDHPDSDLDLHLVREGGMFCDCATDTHYRNCGVAPNWYPEKPGANPRLDVDDRGGFGPENINLDGDGPTRFIPSDGYAVLVHYYAANTAVSSWPTSVSTATVRIFLYGLPAAEFTRELTEQNQLWVAARMTWPAQEIVADDSIVPDALCGGF